MYHLERTEMKKLLLIYVGIFCSVLAFGQTNFQKLTLDEACTKARAEKKLIFVDCYTSWCGPCKMLAPTVDKLAEKYDGKVIVGKVDVDEEQELARQFGVMSIPTVVLFKDGKEVQRTVGVQPQAAFERLVDDIL